jgi:excisionase family DNA binding protein
MTLSRSAADAGDQSYRGQSPGERFFTIALVAASFGVSVRTVRRWIRRGDLVAHHFGAAVRIAESDLKAFIARHRAP